MEDIHACSREGCDKKITARGLCRTHYAEVRAHRRLHERTRYAVIGCDNDARRNAAGSPMKWCTDHYPQRAGVQPDGSRTLCRDGYVLIKVDGSWHPEHRHVMQGLLGRPLVEGENVHHINGHRSDNRAENLELWYRSQPSGQRVSDLIAYIATHHAPALTKLLP